MSTPDRISVSPSSGVWIMLMAADLCLHDEFLAEGETDPRREFSETLLEVCEQFPGVIYGLVVI
jgi:hypothetical protein